MYINSDIISKICLATYGIPVYPGLYLRPSTTFTINEHDIRSHDVSLGDLIVKLLS